MDPRAAGGSFASRPRIVIMGRRVDGQPEASLGGWMVAFTRLDVSRGKETRKKWRARVETGRCGKVAFRLVAGFHGFVAM